MITCLIRYFNTCCHATSYLFTTSKHIVIGCFLFTSSLCLCLQPCDKCLLLLRLTGTEPKKFVGEGILLLLTQFDILLIFVPLVRLFRFRLVLLFIFFVLRFVTITLFTFNGVRSRRIHIAFLIVILSLITTCIISSSLPLRSSSSPYNSIHCCSGSALFKSR